MMKKRIDGKFGGKSDSPKRFRFIHILIIIVVTVTLVNVALFVLPGVRKSKQESNLNLCMNNVKRLSTVIENYKKNTGSYPENLDVLIPGHIQNLPTCPQAEMDTYSAGYLVSPDGSFFILECNGLNHAGSGVKRDFPLYDSREGLVKKK